MFIIYINVEYLLPLKNAAKLYTFDKLHKKNGKKIQIIFFSARSVAFAVIGRYLRSLYIH